MKTLRQGSVSSSLSGCSIWRRSSLGVRCKWLPGIPLAVTRRAPWPITDSDRFLGTHKRRISCRLGAPGGGISSGREDAQISRFGTRLRQRAGLEVSACCWLAGSAAGLRAPGFDDGTQARGLPLRTEGESLVLIAARACLFRPALLRGPLEAVAATARSAARSCRGCADLRPAPAPGKPDPAAAPRPAGAGLPARPGSPRTVPPDPGRASAG